MASGAVATWWRRGVKLAKIGAVSITVGALGVAGLPATYTAGPATGGDTFVTDTTKPAASNTGPAAGGFNPTVLINGDITLAANQVVENRVIAGNVNMGSNSTLRGCLVIGRDFGTYQSRNSMILVPAGLAVPPTIEYTKVRPTAPMHYAMNNLVINGPVNLRRNDISGGTDLIKASGTLTGMEMQASYLHGYSYRDDDLDQKNAPVNVSHNDGVQFHTGGADWYSHGNFWEMLYDPDLSVGAPPSSTDSTGWGCPITVDSAPVTNLRFELEWFSGGGSAGIFQANGSVSGQATGQVRIAFCRSGFNSYAFSGGSRYQIRYLAATYGSVDGETTNYFDASLPGVSAAGLDGQRFVVGASATSGIRRA